MRNIPIQIRPRCSLLSNKMNQIKIVKSRKNNFFGTLEIRQYTKKRMQNVLVVKYRLNARYHQRKNE